MTAVMTQRSRSLTDLLGAAVPLAKAHQVQVSGLCLDSRQIRAGEVFLALSGTREHGLVHAQQALDRGAACVLFDPAGAGSMDREALGALVLPVPELASRVGLMAAAFYDHPSHAMQVVGVTGTDGKTSVSQCLAAALHSDTRPCGVVGTLGVGAYGHLSPATGMTTPDAIALQSLLAQQRAAGIHQLVMEVSSHALSQHRVNGVDFDVAIFTNLGHDHLDYHGSVDAYGQAKARLFRWPNLKLAVLNLDDAFGRQLAENLEGRLPVLGYGLQAYPGVAEQLVASDLSFTPDGLRFQVSTPWGSGELSSRLLGRFNVSNLLAVLGALLHLDVTLSDALDRIARIPTVPGRMELYPSHAQGPALIVDYAHTPQALASVLQAARVHCPGRLFCVFGCGGNRDVKKRPLMAQAAQQYADQVIVTSDNPRHEDPEAIISDILRGFARPQEVLVEVEREAAIRLAFSQAGPKDMVLIAGKGHETWQQIGDQQQPFSDRAIAAELSEVAA